MTAPGPSEHPAGTPGPPPIPLRPVTRVRRGWSVTCLPAMMPGNSHSLSRVEPNRRSALRSCVADSARGPSWGQG